MKESVQTKLEGILAGDRAAAAWLYDSFAPRLYRRLRSRYGFPGGLEVDDLLHDAFVLLLRNGGKLLGDLMARTPPALLTRERLERFLWDQACGLATNQRRSASRRKVVALTDIGQTSAPEDGEAAAIGRDLLARMEACLKERGQRVYLYFTFRYSDGLAPEEISRVTGWSRKATYKMKEALNRAVERCARQLGLVSD